MSQVGNSDNLLTALVAGSTAAAVSATLTYPLDCVKTQQQLNNEGYMKKFGIPGNYPSSISQLYKGGSALVIGNVIKNSARLISYNWSTKFMSVDSVDSKGNKVKKTTAPRIVIAGIMSGIIETLWIIPFENIKITMIQNMTLRNEISRCTAEDFKFDITHVTTHNKHHKPSQNVFERQYVSPHIYYTSDLQHQYKTGKPPTRFQAGQLHPSKLDAQKIQYNSRPTLTFLGTIQEIYSLKGLRGFAAGASITVLRQGAISACWLSTYNATRQLLDPHAKSGEQSWFGHNHTAMQSIGLHLFSSVAVIAVTQPIDVVKSHRQSKNGKSIYKDSLSTAYKLFVRQGPRSLWKGALPRGIKVAVSGGLTASLYAYFEQLVNVATDQTVFTE
ncbi:Piso0_005076 [Millerozyma farinosa CBS 7064]|uniref:Mitochondrial thiamine pyrophosphate carrier 1 n=1 Tax=Pichia sorbitophila (strain ATCC MYA-4447 / BCRC 22081 / CBS 7064 / NBRC 10061 / NRRL Y-12695) TaxID=559304 RepID=G8Y176_PICSO|nr:Piso0_005076 [Millerozyma farinosa CBS 7064]